MSFLFPKPPSFKAADFLQACLNLLPRGRAWAKYQTSNMYQALAVLMPTYERSTAAAGSLLYDAFPANTLQLIPEWESSLGLPDPCAGELTNSDAQRAQIVARFIAGGVSSVPQIVAFAANLGFPITITENVGGFIMGVSAMGSTTDFFGDETNIFVWQVNAPLVNEEFFYMGTSVMGDFLETFTENDVLECEIRRIAPAGTLPIFSYS